jgi:hypothetical protein
METAVPSSSPQNPTLGESTLTRSEVRKLNREAKKQRKRVERRMPKDHVLCAVIKANGQPVYFSAPAEYDRIGMAMASTSARDGVTPVDPLQRWIDHANEKHEVKDA